MINVIKANFAGLGWYIRRTADSAALAECYGGGLGLPLIRGRIPVWFFWGGGALCFELKSDTPPDPARHADPGSVPMCPVFACRDLEAVTSRLRRSGATVVGVCEGDTYVADTDGQLIALRPAAGPFEGGQPEVNVGACPLPSDLAGWGWTLCRVPDVEAEADFFESICGLSVDRGAGQGANVAIGGDVAPGVRLELRAGGETLVPPRTREERTDALIFRVDDHDAVNAALKKARVPLVNDSIRFNSASLTYCLTPSGRLVGFEERFPPARFKEPRREFLEDKLALARRAESLRTLEEEQNGR